jgi:predicted anti-sigma-YlaC factor YlaD
MMNDCQNVEIREALPDLVHGTLSSDERARVQEHLGRCVDCAAELAIIRAVHNGVATTPVDVARIVAAIPPYRRRSSFSGMRRVYLELAAACVIGAIGISTIAVHNSGSRPVQSAAVQSAAGPGLALVSTNELSDEGLARLTEDLGDLQAMPTLDPESVTPAALQDDAEPGTVGDSA